jgi:hypothetical protein
MVVVAAIVAHIAEAGICTFGLTVRYQLRTWLLAGYTSCSTQVTQKSMTKPT